ncbi:MAG: FtsQ-type POTRA domain-containing protein [Pseudomonadales bacterium]
MNVSRSTISNYRGASRARVNRKPLGENLLKLLKRSVKPLLLTAFLGVLGFGAYWVSPKLNWPVENVVLEGDFHWLDQSAVHKAITENLDGDLLSLDNKKLREVIRQVTLVENAEISRVYPDSLIVLVKEERPVAQWNDQGYISSQGKFIESPVYTELSALPRLSSRFRGVDVAQGAREAIEIYHLLNSAVLVSGESIEALDQDASGGWTMVWESGLEIDLGRSDHLKRVRHALAAWRRLPVEKQQNIGEIDARYDNGVAIRVRQIQADDQLAKDGKSAGNSPAAKTDNPV